MSQTTAAAALEYAVSFADKDPYHSARLVEVLSSEYETDEATRVTMVRLYCENQGDKFRPHSAKMLSILGGTPASTS